MTNNLISETSPYLLQHKDNPVNWFAWNDKTLSYAKRKNMPILLSIGYSSCHWCHVMAHESFEDKYIASIMNSSFINGNWEKPYIRFYNSFKLNQSIMSVDFSDSDDLLACLQKDGEVEFIDMLNSNIYYNLTLDTQQNDENIIKFIDDYSFIIGSINGNLYHHQLK